MQETPLNVITVGSDRALFVPESSVRARLAEYGTLVDELHIIVFTKRSLGLVQTQIAPNVWVYPTNSWNRWFYVRDAVRLGKRISKERSIALVSVQDPFEGGLAGMRVARSTKARLQIQIHTDLMSPAFQRGSHLNKVRMRIARKVLPQAQGIRVVSNRIKESLSEAFPVLADRITVLPIFVDIAKMRVTPAAFSVREKYPQFDWVAITVARLEPEKNLSLGLHAFARVVEKYPKSGLVLVGEGGERARLEAEARRLGIGQNVVFEGARTDVLSYYKTADLFLLTSNFEGYGMALVEAAAADCPIVTTDVGVAQDILHNGEARFMCPVGDAMCLATGMLALRENTELRKVAVLKTQSFLEQFALIDKTEYLKRYRMAWERCLV
ncbi:MAG: hypothetical protein A2408_02570 [Candidatus Yonathbacteria bacterium RIFOXYC1_FULL_52_10]|uniref:Glycosyl transferase family 1 domain-containing protein n=1 Tax=Candidatus Yonathbacteria bacterium RIFOXYD1_FULL_52_36 TaxID=1802730 RepID=A0A1G2SLU5_9BACT|nr:MAG: hypothetical protein A2408_02570 [Candidatus Yonathbacteria bacterium RIFOXYC1_FULL_52_10]OHA85668.1 MAG: hypothetical protein A2591_02440 [Candidatus Yonathbacteria bacterium RIFOXYD1_FULL_52_36]